MDALAYGLLLLSAGIASVLHFCALFKKCWTYSKVRLGMVVVIGAILSLPLVQANPPKDLQTFGTVHAVMVSVGCGCVAGALALILACQRRKSAISSLIGRFLKCKPR
jgi:glucose dehydrogenase